MKYRFALVTVIVFLSVGKWIGGQDQTSIPNHLQSCYKIRPQILPQTIETLIEIIRKIEMSPTFNMDMRTFTNSLLHKFRVDGIEKDPNVVQLSPGILPYKTSGFQSYRQQILLYHLIPESNMYLPMNVLSEVEKCNLHWMISSSVDIWERGDEMRVCPSSFQGYLSTPLGRYGTKMSCCPEEWGVIYQEHGTISPGTVIAGIAAALSPLLVQQSAMIKFSDRPKPIGWDIPYPLGNGVNNTYAATLAGDLAEVIEFQAAKVKDIYIGPAGVWNDSYVPTAYYFSNLDKNRIEVNAWQVTDAEILGGIDGLLLSKQIASLVNQIKSLRLSQILEMYYSDKGVMSDSNLRACNREMNALNLINQEKQSLLAQVQNFAHVLAAKVPSFSTDDKFIDQAARQTVDKFLPYLSDLVRRNKCLPRIPRSEKMNLNIILDQTLSSNTALQVIMYLSRAVDVGYYGSKITVINGQKGSLMVNAAQNTSSVFLDWYSSVTDLGELNLPQSLLTLKSVVENSVEQKKTLTQLNSESEITIVMSYGSTISDSDHDKAKNLISAVKALNPDMKFVYITSRANSPRFVQFTALPQSHNDKIVSLDNVNNIPAFLSQLQDAISLVPKSLTAVYCNKNTKGLSESEYEELITPGHFLKYRIHPDYLCGSSNLQIKIINQDYGYLQVCLSRDEVTIASSLCKHTKTGEHINFDIDKPCVQSKTQKNMADLKQQWIETCKPIFLDVSTLSSSNKCSGKECRYPDQIKFKIVLKGLRCVEPFKAICSSCYLFGSNFILLLASVIFISI